MNDSIATLALDVDTRKLLEAERAQDRFGKSSQQMETKATGATAAIGRSFTRLVPLIGAAVAALGAGAGFSASIREAEKFETTMFRVEAVIRATGGSAGRSAEQLRQQARSIASSTLESTEGVLRAQQTMLTFRNIQGEVFDRAIVAAADMTAALGGDLNSAAMQLSKALENPTEGLSALSRSGTVFTQAQKDMVAAMVEAGDTASAQAFILSELEAQYGGTAAAAAGGLAGAQDTLAQSMQELRLEIGEALLPAMTNFTLGLARVVEAVSENLVPALKTAGVVVAGLAATQLPAIVLALGSKLFALGSVTTALGLYTGAVRIATAATALLGGPLGIVLGLIGAGAAAWVLFRNDTNSAATAMTGAETAAAQLSLELDLLARSDLPNASAATVQLANDNLALARSSFSAARAQVELAKATQQNAFVQSSVEDAFLPGMVNPGQAALDASNRALAESVAALIAAEEELNATIFNGNQIQTETADLLDRNTEATGTLADASVAATDAVGGVGSAAKTAATDTAKAVEEMESAYMGLARDGVGRAVDWMVNGFKGGMSEIRNIFMDTLRQMIATAARNRIMIGLGLGGGGGVAGMAGAATAGSGLMGGAGILGSIGAFGSSIGTGLSVVGSGFAAGGFSGAATAGMGAISGGLGMGGAVGFGTALGAAVPVIGAVALAFGALRKKTTELDSGIDVAVRGFDTAVETFRRTETSRFFGLSRRTSTSSRNDPNNPLHGAVSDIQTAIADAANVLGYGSTIFDQFTFDFRLSLKGMTEDQKLQAINAQLATMGDEFARLVPGMENMNQVLDAANQAVAEAGQLGRTRFESEMLMAARRRGEFTVDTAGPGGTNTENLIRLRKIEEADAKVASNTTQANEIMNQLLQIFKRFEIDGIPRGPIVE